MSIKGRYCQSWGMFWKYVWVISCVVGKNNNNNLSKCQYLSFFVFFGGQKSFGTIHLFFYIFKTQTNGFEI